MSKVTFKQTGSFSNTIKFMNRVLKRDYLNILNTYGQKGVSALAAATPKDTGLTSESWTYEIKSDKTSTTISWYNTNEVTNKTGYNFNIVILLQYGHATRNGGWVEGFDFINPAMKPIFDELAEKAWNAIIEN